MLSHYHVPLNLLQKINKLSKIFHYKLIGFILNKELLSCFMINRQNVKILKSKHCIEYP